MTNEYANTLGVATYGYWSTGIGSGTGDVIVVTELFLEVDTDPTVVVEVTTEEPINVIVESDPVIIVEVEEE